MLRETPWTWPCLSQSTMRNKQVLYKKHVITYEYCDHRTFAWISFSQMWVKLHIHISDTPGVCVLWGLPLMTFAITGSRLRYIFITYYIQTSEWDVQIACTNMNVMEVPVLLSICHFCIYFLDITVIVSLSVIYYIILHLSKGNATMVPSLM